MKRILVTALSLFVLTKLFDTISFGSTYALLLTSLVFILANTFLKPILKFLKRPINVLSMGLVSFPINGLILFLSTNLIDGAYIESLSAAVFLSIALSFVSSLFQIPNLGR